MRPFVHLVPLSAVCLSVLPYGASKEASDSPGIASCGRYVEARTASVFAGACHYGSEAATQGREALLAWHFEAGAHEGESLSGCDLVAVICGEANLAEPGTARRSLIYVSRTASESQRKAAVDLVRERCASALGEVQAVRAIEMSVVLSQETYAVTARGLFELRGATMPDRACCKMPYNVWYKPFAAVEAPIVGLNTDFVFSDKSLGPVWSRPEENASFLARFEFAANP